MPHNVVADAWPQRAKLGGNDSKLPKYKHKWNLRHKSDDEVDELEEKLKSNYDFFDPKEGDFLRGQIDTNRIVRLLHAKLMQNLNQPLPISDNGLLCHVFEVHRRLVEENEELFKPLEEENKSLRLQFAEEVNMRIRAEKSWTDLKDKWDALEKDYKADIKRLEVLVANSNHGIEGVVKARQNSVLRKRQYDAEDSRASAEEKMETFQEFLQSTKDEQVPFPELKGVERHDFGLSPNKTLTKKLSTASLDGYSPTASPMVSRHSSLPNSSILAASVDQENAEADRGGTDASNALADLSKLPTGSGGQLKGLKVSKYRGSSTPSGLDNALSSLKNWMDRKNHKKTTQPLGENPESSPSTDASSKQSRPKPQRALTAERELRRPFSFYVNDEEEFAHRISKGNASPISRHRSWSTSEFQSPQKESAPLGDVENGLSDTARPSSMDTIRTIRPARMSDEPDLYVPRPHVRKVSTSSSVTAIHSSTTKETGTVAAPDRSSNSSSRSSHGSPVVPEQPRSARQNKTQSVADKQPRDIDPGRTNTAALAASRASAASVQRVGQATQNKTTIDSKARKANKKSKKKSKKGK